MQYNQHLSRSHVCNMVDKASFFHSHLRIQYILTISYSLDGMLVCYIICQVYIFSKGFYTEISSKKYLSRTVISQLVHSISSLDVPLEYLGAVNSAIFKFTWKNKKDKVKRKVMILDYDQGGLREEHQGWR